MIHLYCINPDCLFEFRKEQGIGKVIPANEFDINEQYFCDSCRKVLVSENDSEVSKLLWGLGIEEPKNQSDD